MSSLKFSPGETLSAAKLNALVAAVTGGDSGAATAKFTQPLATQKTTQRQFSSVLPGGQPVLLDNASPYLPPGSGFFVRLDDSLSRSPVSGTVAPESPVYLVQNTDPWGNVSSTSATMSAPSPVQFNPLTGERGVNVHRLGQFIEDPARPGARSEKTRFVDNPQFPPVPYRLFSEAPTTATETAFYKASLLADNSSPQAQILKNLESTGGIIFEQKTCNILQVVPLFDISEAPSTSSCWMPPNSNWRPPTPGQWRTIASATVGSQQLDLMARWLAPWKIETLFNVSGSGGSTCSLTFSKVTWQSAWGLPGAACSSPPYTIDSTTWDVPYLSVPCAVNWNSSLPLWAEAISEVQAYAPSTQYVDAGNNLITVPEQHVILRAYLRKMLAPSAGPWHIWYEQQPNVLPWQNQ